jgi:O-antigen/teichoic acid export membrane protein
MILSPTFNVIYPRLSALVIAEDTEKLIHMYRTGTRLLLSVLFPIAAFAAVFSQQILVLWTKNQELAVISAPVVSLFLVGTALNGAMHFPYALQLAFGMTRLPLVINGILMTVMIPMTIYLATQYGVVGGAASWAVLNGIYLVVGSWLTHRTLLKGIGFKWFMWDVIMPLCLTLMVVLGIGRTITNYRFSYVIELCIGVGLAFFAFVLIIIFSPSLKNTIKMYFGEIIQ